MKQIHLHTYMQDTGRYTRIPLMLINIGLRLGIIFARGILN